MAPHKDAVCNGDPAVVLTVVAPVFAVVVDTTVDMVEMLASTAAGRV
jgi:hypothetical protein